MSESGDPPPGFAGNLFEQLPENLEEEVPESILRDEHVMIERIVSQGHASPEQGWYDQTSHEWVVVLRGGGKLEFADGREVEMRPGDHLLIPAGTRHRVAWTDPTQPTLWLAVHFRS